MRVLLLGGSGNIGTALLRRIRDVHPEWTVAAMARRPPDGASAPYDIARWLPIDLSEAGCAEPLTAAMQGIGAVVNLAWAIQPSRNEGRMARTNIDGTARALTAARQTGVPHVVQLSSVGAYAKAVGKPTVDESWDTSGIDSSAYSRHKAAVERLLDLAEQGVDAPIITRIRPGLVLQGAAGAEIGRYFLGIWGRATRVAQALPVFPVPSDLIADAIHADDVASALVAVLERRAGGPFNLAADDPLTPDRIAAAFGARRVGVPYGLVRLLAAASWQARIQPTDAGWLDMARGVPLLDTGRARRELDWAPTRTVESTLQELVDGLARGSGTSSPVMSAR